MDTPLFRITIEPNADNGLKVSSQIMVEVNRALAVFLGIA